MSRRIVVLVSLSLLTACAPQDDAFPTADAGFSINGEVGQEFVFDGSASDGESWSWSLTSVPHGSGLRDESLLAASTPWPRLVPDVEGAYVLDLEVCDALGSCDWSQTTALVGHDARMSLEATQKVKAPALTGLFGGPKGGNQAPVALATAARSLRAGGAIQLQGGDSYDPDGDSLRYSWTFESVPAGSQVDNSSLTTATASRSSFTPDVSGTWQVRLTVRDTFRRDDALVTIVVRAGPDDDPLD